jgi:hypothetical protein
VGKPTSYKKVGDQDFVTPQRLEPYVLNLFRADEEQVRRRRGTRALFLYI